MIEALRADFIRWRASTASASGASSGGTRCATRSRPLPGLRADIQYLVGGVIVAEDLFGYPGLGKELVDSVAVRDVSAVQSIAS